MNPVRFRLARREDLPEIVRMLADDELGSQREKCEEPLLESYDKAFEQIRKDLNHQLVVAELDSPRTRLSLVRLSNVCDTIRKLISGG